MTLPLKMPYAPMEALLVAELPENDGWQYEPKWDGFRCLAFRDGAEIALQSKSGQPLGRYFPDVIDTLRALRAQRFVLDGEIVVPRSGSLSFDDLLMRIHPAASRVNKLATETPAAFVAFDLLVDDKGKALVTESLRVRRQKLEAFVRRHFPKQKEARIRLSPASAELAMARKWFRSSGGGLDGVIAKRLDQRYLSGERAMLKIKQKRTADCVVGGFRYASRGKIVGSLLLGLYDDEGLLHHVGFTSSLSAKDRQALTPQLEKLVQPPGFTGRAPGGPSRWSTARSSAWQPLKPKLVVEVEFDHITGGRFRHGAKFVRWRPDKTPTQCTYQQIAPPGRNMWKMLA